VLEDGPNGRDDVLVFVEHALDELSVLDGHLLEGREVDQLAAAVDPRGDELGRVAVQQLIDLRQDGADHRIRDVLQRPEVEPALVVGRVLEPPDDLGDPRRGPVGPLGERSERDSRHPQVTVARQLREDVELAALPL
jgi:hypothetical protein